MGKGKRGMGERGKKTRGKGGGVQEEGGGRVGG